MPSFAAFCLSEPRVLFIRLAIFATGVLAFECCFSSLMSAPVYGLLLALFVLAFANFVPLEAN
jgi:hypothetical protein